MSKFWSNMAKRTKPYVPGEQVQATDIIKLNTNENPYPPSPQVTSAIQTATNHDLRLYPSPTMEDLKESIAAYYNLRTNNVFVGNGSDEVLAFSFMAFFNPNKTILFPEISYSFYPVYAGIFQIPYETLPLQDDFSIQPKDYFQADGGVIFPNPNAPTSRYLSVSAVEHIVQQNPDTVVVIDEAYIDFAPDSSSAAKLVEKYENILIIQTMSKSRSLAGLRVGFALGSPDLIEGLMRIKDSFNSYPVDRLALVGAKAAIEDTAYFEETRKKIIQTRTWVMKELENRGFHVLPSAANFVFVTHPTVAASKLYEKLREQHIFIRYFGKPPIEDYVRISIGTDEEMKHFFHYLDKIV